MNAFLIVAVVVAAIAGLAGLYVYAWSVPTWQIFAPAIVRGPAEGRRVALTFDDGPAPPFTEQILNILLERRVKATFFLCGKNAARYPEIARRIGNEGHGLGNHTYSHPALYFRSRRFMAKEIDRTQDVVERITGRRPALFRPPYGARWHGLESVLRERGMRLVNWSDTGYDWEYGAERIVSETLKHLAPGSIILLHDGLETSPPRPIDRSATVLALPAIIDAALEAGYRFVTADELLELEPESPAKASPPEQL